ncbi:MAG: hypothetical protein JXA73_08805 [Acidobacteria bacterium]|nr:hypothetical protein [Acidobacteriota bacterium]
MGSSKFELVILVDPTKANQSIKSVNTSILGLERQAAASSGGMAKVWEKSAADAARATHGTRRAMREAADAAELLGAQIGLRLPREVRKFIGETKLLGAALSTAFKFSIYIAAAMTLIDWIKNIGEKLGWWGDKAEETARKNDELTRSVQEQNRTLDDYYTNLERMQRERALIGLSGSAKGAIEVRYSAEDVRKARADVETFQARVNKLTLELGRTQKSRVKGGAPELTPEYIAKSQEVAKAEEALLSASMAYGVTREAYLSKQAELRQIQKEEAEKSAKEEKARQKKADEEWLQAQVDLFRRRSETEAAERDFAIKLERDVNKTLAEMNQAQMSEDERRWKEYWEKRKEAVRDLARENENMVLSQRRAAKDYLGVQSIELQRLDEMKKLYEDNAEAIALIEERKKLVIMDTNQQIARDAQDKFEKSANRIEHFFNRVFLQAKSFSDVWKQLLSELANYTVSSVAKMVAAWTTGMGRMSPAGAAPGYAGAGGMLGSFFTGSGGGGSTAAGVTPSFLPTSSGGGGLGGLVNVGGIKDFLGLGGKMVTAPGGALNIPFGQLGLGGKLSAIGKSNAALAGGAMLAMMGLKRGGLSGLGMTTAGGAMIGFKFGGGLGAAIGAGIGAVAGTIRLFMKSAEDKAKAKVKATYGVNIPDKGVLSQIVEIARQGFGGNLDMAVRSVQVEDLVRLYAMTTGQSTQGMRAQMTAGMLMQSGGSLYQQRQYVNGLAIGSSGRIPIFHAGIDFVPRDMLAYLGRGERVTPAHENALPGAGLDSIGKAGELTTINITIPGAKKFFQDETVSVVVRNPQAVQKASTLANRISYNRRQLTALQLSPGTITS